MKKQETLKEMVRRVIKEESSLFRTTQPPKNYGVLIVTKDKKFVIYTHGSPYKKVPLKKGMEITKFIRDDNPFSAKKTIEYEGKQGEWIVIRVKYDYGTYNKFDGKYQEV